MRAPDLESGASPDKSSRLPNAQNDQPTTGPLELLRGSIVAPLARQSLSLQVRHPVVRATMAEPP